MTDLPDSPLCDGDPLARDLAALLPAATAVTPAAVLFAAGEQAARDRARPWRMATGATGLLFVGSWVGMAMRPAVETPRAAVNPPEFVRQTDRSPIEKMPPPSERPKPAPQLLASDDLPADLLDARVRGVRLRHDILAGGLGLIPSDPWAEQRQLPSGGFFDSNRTVLGGYYRPRADEAKPPE